MKKYQPLVIGHRGAAALLPENTLDSFHAAFDTFGADMIEFDVHLTRDHVPVVIHDATLERTTDGRGYISQWNLVDLKNLDAGYSFTLSGKNDFPCRGRGIKIPTLAEVFETFPKHRFAIEIKEKSSELTHCVASLVKKYKAETFCVAGSKHDLVSSVLRKTYPGIPRFFSQPEIVMAFLNFRRGVTPKKDSGAVASMPLKGCHMPFDSEAFIQYLHAKETKVFYWTINDPPMMKTLRDKQADGIISDDPGLAASVIRKCGIDPTDV